jgi:hypothetical protein
MFDNLGTTAGAHRNGWLIVSRLRDVGRDSTSNSVSEGHVEKLLPRYAIRISLNRHNSAQEKTSRAEEKDWARRRSFCRLKRWDAIAKKHLV